MVQKNMYESMDASLLKPKDGYRSFISKRVGNVAFKCNIFDYLSVLLTRLTLSHVQFVVIWSPYSVRREPPKGALMHHVKFYLLTMNIFQVNKAASQFGVF